MIEAGANEVPEDKMIEAIYKAHEVNQEIIHFIDKIVADCGKENICYELPAQYRKSCLRQSRRSFLRKKWKRPYSQTTSRQERRKYPRDHSQKLKKTFADNEEWLAVLGEAVYQYQKKTVRKMILKDHKRPDGREITEIRPLGSRSGYHPESSRFCNVHKRTDSDLYSDNSGSSFRGTET